MNIAIDGYEANVPQRLGSSQVAFELINNLAKIDKSNDYTVLLPDAPLSDLPALREGWNYKILKPKKFWTKLVLPWALYTASPKPDVVFSPTHYIPRFSPSKRVVTVFDLAFLRFPQAFTKKDLWQLKTGTAYSIKNADHIITISQSTKKDIVEAHGVETKKITVAYPGFNPEIFYPITERDQVDKVLSKYDITGDYIIYIGTVQPRKNLTRLMEAVAKIEGLKLVIVGKTSGPGRQGWMFVETLQKPRELGVESRVIFTGYVPQQDLPYLLAGAYCYVLPSLWEGFGIPVVEAMACGTPVIVSNVSSLPEVAGNAGLLVDPYCVDQIEQAIRAIISDKKLRAKKSKEAVIQAKKFSWEKMAKTVIRVLGEVGKG